MQCWCQGENVVKVVGLCDPYSFDIVYDPYDIYDPYYPNAGLGNWTQISIPEVFQLPCEKPDIETIDKVLVDVKILSKRIVTTPILPNGENAEGTRLTGRKLVVEGLLKQKVVYTAKLPTQPVHAAHFDVPFSAFIVLSRSDVTDWCVDTCIEDVFVMPYSCREIFKNVTLLLQARPILPSTGCLV